MNKRYNNSTSLVREEVPVRREKQPAIEEIQEQETSTVEITTMRGSLASSVAAPAVVDGTANTAVTRFPSPTSKLKRI